MLRDGGLISIIVPVYNVKDYLDRCMDSIVNQTYTNIEIIMVDDGSDDGSEEMCDRWGQKDNRVRVYHEKNGGVSMARNLGLDVARGEFIGFVDSDDFIKEDMYESLLANMDDRTDITCCGTAVLCSAGQRRQTQYYDVTTCKKVFSNNEAIKELMLKRYLSFSPCNKLFRRVLFERLIYPVKKTAEDLPVVYELVKRSRRVVNIGKVKYYYCYREDSASRKPFEMARISYVLFARDIYKDVVTNYPSERKVAEALYIRNILTIINEINHSEDIQKYKCVCNRLRKVLLRMYTNILLNEYISMEMKKNILRLL